MPCFLRKTRGSVNISKSDLFRKVSPLLAEHRVTLVLAMQRLMPDLHEIEWFSRDKASPFLPSVSTHIEGAFRRRT